MPCGRRKKTAACRAAKEKVTTAVTGAPPYQRDPRSTIMTLGRARARTHLRTSAQSSSSFHGRRRNYHLNLVPGGGAARARRCVASISGASISPARLHNFGPRWGPAEREREGEHQCPRARKLPASIKLCPVLTGPPQSPWLSRVAIELACAGELTLAPCSSF